MQPKGGESMNFEVPPQPEQRPEDGEQRQDSAVERAPVRPERSAQAAKQPALPVVPDDIPAAEPPVLAAPPADDAAQPSSFDPHQSAKDSDRIEPEWVDKAKSVIAQTRDDPYMQKDEMSKIKADYIQKRFGKQIKTDEAAA